MTRNDLAMQRNDLNLFSDITLFIYLFVCVKELRFECKRNVAVCRGRADGKGLH